MPSASPSGSRSGAGAGAGVGAGAGTDPAVHRTTVEFDAGQLFERYDHNRNGFLDKTEFQRLCKDMGLQATAPGMGMGGPGSAPGTDPSPRTSFDAGRLFQRCAACVRRPSSACLLLRELQTDVADGVFDGGEGFFRYDTTGAGRLDRTQFERFVGDFLRGSGHGAPANYPWAPRPAPVHYTPPWSSSFAPRGHPVGPSSFTAGRLFEMYDRNRSGSIERGEFERLVNDLRHNRAPALAATAPSPPGMGGAHSSVPRLPLGSAGFGGPTAPPQGGWDALGMYGGHLSAMDQYRTRLSDLTALTARLMVKREQMMQQVSIMGRCRLLVEALLAGGLTLGIVISSSGSWPRFSCTVSMSRLRSEPLSVRRSCVMRIGDAMSCQRVFIDECGCCCCCC